MTRASWILGLVGGLAVAPSAARAQDYATPLVSKPSPPPRGFPKRATDVPGPWQPRTGVGAGILLGGGAYGFLGAGAESVAEIGGSWEARLLVGTRRLFGLELAYVGSSSGLQMEPLGLNASFLRNGFEACARLNAPIERDGSLIEPFAFAGGGWNYFTLENTFGTMIGFPDHDNVLVVPTGAGVALSYRGFMVDVRFTYRLAYSDDLLNGADMRSWNASASLGGEF